MKNFNRFNLEEIVSIETQRILEEILGGNLDYAEKDLQDMTSMKIKSRGVKAPPKKSKEDSDDDDAKAKSKSGDRKLNQRQEADDESTEQSADKKNTKKETEAAPAPEKREDRTGGKGTADSPKLKPSRESLMEPSFDDVLNNVALIRGGKSAKNPEIKKALRRYYDDMTGAERRAMNVFLLGVAQVLSTIEDPVDPDDAGIKLKGEKNQQAPLKSSNTGIFKDSKAGTESNPIVVGESANKGREKAILALYRGR
jgi:hypothetical protein